MSGTISFSVTEAEEAHATKTVESAVVNPKKEIFLSMLEIELDLMRN